MEYVRLRGAGVKVSRIALGLGFRGQSSVGAARRLIEHAIDSGVNFIDCANFYRVIGGPLSEDVVKPVLSKRRDEVVVTSKVYGHVGPGPNDGGSTRYHILSQVERSLRRLGTDHVDVYLLHQFDDETPVDETVRALDDMETPEPLPADHPLVSLENCVILPHIGSATVATRTKMAVMTTENLLAGVEGRPLPNPVDLS